MNKWSFFLFLLLIMAFLYYSPSLHFYFTSDDFFYINFLGLKEVFSIHKDLYHYNPIFWFLMYILRDIFGPNPSVFHFITIILHLINIILVLQLTKIILKNSKLALLSSTLFAFFFANYEVVYWVTGISTSLMVIFYLLSVMVFLSYCHRTNKKKALLFTIFSSLAILTHEYSLSLTIVCSFYLLAIEKFRRKKAVILVIPSVLTLLLFLLKKSLTTTSLFVITPSFLRVIASVVKSTIYLFIPLPQLIDRLPKFFLPLLFIFLIIFFLGQIHSNKKRLFLFVWIVITILTFSLTSLPQARYFYLSFIPTVILLTSILTDKHLIINRFKISIILYFMVVFLGGIAFLNTQKMYWTKSSIIIKKTIAQIKSSIPKIKPSINIYLVNLPDSINGPPWNAYLFRSGLSQALEMNDVKNINQIFYVRTSSSNKILREDLFMDQKDLNKLEDSEAFIFTYDRITESLVRQ